MGGDVGPVTGCTPLPGDDEMPLAVVRHASPRRAAGAVAVVDVAERRALAARAGAGAIDTVRARVAELAAVDARPGETLTTAIDGALVLLLPDASEDEAGWRLDELARRVAHARFAVAGEAVHLTPLIGWAALPPAGDAAALAAAREALIDASFLLDLHPVRRSA